MREFKNDIGLSASFEKELPTEQILLRLKWLGTNWKEVDKNGFPINDIIHFEKVRA